MAVLAPRMSLEHLGLAAGCGVAALAHVRVLAWHKIALHVCEVEAVAVWSAGLQVFFGILGAALHVTMNGSLRPRRLWRRIPPRVKGLVVLHDERVIM